MVNTENMNNPSYGSSTHTTMGQLLENNCDTVAIQNNGNKNPSESLEFDYTEKSKNIVMEFEFSLIQNPAQLLLLRPFQLWLFEDQQDTETQYKHILQIEPSTFSYFLTNFIALFMVTLAIYQVIVDGYELYDVIDSFDFFIYFRSSINFVGNCISLNFNPLSTTSNMMP